MGISDEFHKVLVKKWLLQTIAILFNSNNKPNSSQRILVLQGGQGIGKTKFLRHLAIKNEFFQGGLVLNMKNKGTIISATRGKPINYKCILQLLDGIKLEIYEDYALLYYLESGHRNILSNSMQGGSSGSIIYFPNLTLQLISTVDNTSALRIDIVNNNSTSTISMSLNL